MGEAESEMQNGICLGPVDIRGGEGYVHVVERVWEVERWGHANQC